MVNPDKIYRVVSPNNRQEPTKDTDIEAQRDMVRRQLNDKLGLEDKIPNSDADAIIAWQENGKPLNGDKPLILQTPHLADEIIDMERFEQWLKSQDKAAFTKKEQNESGREYGE